MEYGIWKDQLVTKEYSLVPITLLLSIYYLVTERATTQWV